MSERAFEESIAELLGEERARAHISLDSVAEHACVSVPTIHHWENGRVRPSSLWHLKRWAEALGAKLEVRVVTKDGVKFKF